MDTSLEPVRLWIAGQIRTRVVGDEPARAVAAIDAPGPRWFAEDRVIRRVHSDASMFVGGLRAILLQSLHPLAMAGVAEHSDYRADPWGRLQRTADFLAATTFGPASLAEESIARVRHVHRRVRGTAPNGRAYSAGDPHLLRWVHVCEVDSFLASYRRYGAGELTAAQADEYVADMAVVAGALGVNHPPTSVADLRNEFRDFRDELEGTKAAREAARFLLVDPPLPLAARPAYALLGTAAVALLPMWARWPLRLPYLPVSEAVLVRPAGAAVTRLIRWSLAPA
ncbi:MAG: oxygenase MpaB family protein [Actinomycetota bacterium]|nr:oxygenase MpaB family protein [Actinomycetota bacterium]